MTDFFPNYYKEFKCIADRCKHNCCIGWEIDIDSETLEMYKETDERFGTHILDTIAVENTPHFVLCDDERCPQLDEKGLCRLISNFGEGALCQICTDHPRFRNFFENFTETGLGLCCEEAARIVLSCKEPFKLVTTSEHESFEFLPWEKEILDDRNEIFSVLCNRDLSMKERLKELSEQYSVPLKSLTVKNVSARYLSLERLDEAWTEIVEGISDSPDDLDSIDFQNKDLEFEQLASYLVFRHYADFAKEMCEKECVYFVLSACVLIASLCYGWKEIHIPELVRMFSSEVEYSEDNIYSIMNDWN